MEGTTSEVVADDLERIGNYVRANLPGWLREVDGDSLIGPKLLERMVRVEEELKGMGARFEREFAAQRELMVARFEAVDKRFESVDKRFETMDKRFEDMQRRLAGMQWIVGTGFAFVMILVSLIQVLG